MKNTAAIPFHLTTAAQFIRILIQTFHAVFIAALWGAASIGAFVGYFLLVGQETVALPPVPMDSPFSHTFVVVFVIGALVGMVFHLTGDVAVERRAITESNRLKDRNGQS